MPPTAAGRAPLPPSVYAHVPDPSPTNTQIRPLWLHTAGAVNIWSPPGAESS